ncbi:hypothetical protein [Alkalimarinus sediminis]|uniref:Uncharacterized protein n=1 Tax=Alkalimarinus sediminis TaxID=1632866 RepID=A0A9E8HKV2_9ALTE|nr:hypothetical protein [Alkalimarinus sediminis]UZW76299.1 hypothetical protein NNL22_06865 [Alkalimarinus sediminis]
MQALDYTHRGSPLNTAVLLQENEVYQGTGGVSQQNRSRVFLPAFFDTLSGKTYLSRFANGRLALIYLLDGLPKVLIVNSTAPEKDRCIRNTVVSGFMLGERFYTRDQAALYMSKG